jgi:hypothetical protein
MKIGVGRIFIENAVEKLLQINGRMKKENL